MIDQWHDFFLMMGGGAAALTGLVFVAMTLNLGEIVRETTHKHRAINTLTGFTGVVVICALALMGGQDYQSLATYWCVSSTIAGCIYVYGVTKARIKGRSRFGLGLPRIVFGALIYIIEIIGTIMLLHGYITGLYIAAISMVVLLTFTITGAWLLLVGVEEDRQHPNKMNK